MKIPNETHKFVQANNSDLFGNLSRTKSINFNEEGYLKLSSRAVSLYNSTDDTEYNIPTSFGRYTNGSFFVATTETPYILSITDGVSSIAKDTDNGDDPAPSMNFSTFGKWWRNLWHITNDTKLYYKTPSNGNWTDTGISALSAGKAHPIVAFEKANTLMVADGNTARQLDSSYATGTLAQLTLSSEYEIVSMAYNSNTLGIGTRLSSTVEGQDKEAQFFTWDGSESSANSGYGVGSDSIISVFPYKSSFGILNRNGNLLYFNGGGFDYLDSFPAYFKEIIWGDPTNVSGYGDMIKVDGEKIYININSEIFDNNKNSFDVSMIGGIWCYDPNIGLHHRYSPSISKAQIIYSREADVNVTTNTITAYNSFSLPSSPTLPPTGSPVKILSSAVGGISAGNFYYIIKSSSTEYKLASTKTEALAGTAIDLTSAGIIVVMTLDVKDYGQSRVSRPGGIGFMGYKQYSYDDIIFGGEYYPTTSTSNVEYLNISVYGFKNIGLVETSKINSINTEDTHQKIFIKYKPLGTDDKIIVKKKQKDIYGLPLYASCTVASSSVITTTSNIEKAYLITDEELECEVVSGSGAGKIVKINSITYAGGVYSLNLAESIDEFTANDVCSVVISNWDYVGEITSADSLGWKEFSIAKNSKWFKYKLILEGSDITLEELQVDNVKHI